METDTANRYRSRILREMNANRENPFNSPPSSTGSHGTVSPTLSSLFSDPEGESTRRLNEDIARVTAPRKLPVNWDAAHRKWPEYFSKPKTRDYPTFDDNTDTRPLSAQSKENKPPRPSFKYNNDDSTRDVWSGSERKRSEMQARADNESDFSLILSKSPRNALAAHGVLRNNHHRSPLTKSHHHAQSEPARSQNRRSSITEALDRLRKASASPIDDGAKHTSGANGSPHVSSEKSSFTAVPPSPVSVASPGFNTSNARSFFMPDVSHLGDFVTGTLRFSGSMQNGVPVFVKHGKVHDRKEAAAVLRHAAIDAISVPEDEEKIFVSMDMIRDEIISLQEHHEKVQEYALGLQQKVEKLESQLKFRGSGNEQGSSHNRDRSDELQLEVAALQTRLEQATRNLSTSEINKDSLAHERDRVMNKLQEACDDINKLTRKLSYKDKELESSGQIRQDNDVLRRDLVSITHRRDALELENSSLRSDNEQLRKDLEGKPQAKDSLRTENNRLQQEQLSLLEENRSLRSSNDTLANENEELRDSLDGVQHDLDAVREEVETLRKNVDAVKREAATLREDNESLVRHNEKYFSENKMLRRENSAFERSVHALHDENALLKDEVEFLKEQLDHYRPRPKNDNTTQLNEKTENMTSAFFVPDITIKTNVTAPEEPTQTGEYDPTDFTTQNTDNQTRPVSRRSSAPPQSNAQKVAFSLPDSSVRMRNAANQGTKRRSLSQSRRPKHTTDLVSENDDTTGVYSIDAPDDPAVELSLPVSIQPEMQKKAKPRTKRTHETSRESTRAEQVNLSRIETNLTLPLSKASEDNTCPALSNDAKRVLDKLCGHNCHNCIVCTRITSHRGVVTTAELASGKKRITVPRPIPVTDREVLAEDATMRPAQSPGHALALVIKGLEDESHHMQSDLSRLQTQYNSIDKALGKRDRLALAESIRTLLKRVEVKNDQIYSLYDVLEGQKAAGQAMTEEELEMTVLNITGMTVRDVTQMSDQLTWEGFQ